MRGLVVLLLWLVGLVAASAEPCPGNPDALGTSRVLKISPTDFKRIGSMQYAQTLPLKDHEVVITFDDGPIPPYTNSVLETLASHCVKATYFLVGEMAQAYPSIVRRIYNEGHTIGTHSQNHPLRFQRLTTPGLERQVDRGIASVDAALGDPKALSPFFRIPGLGRTNAVEKYLASKSLVTWSADVVGDDWKRISAREIVRRTMRRLDEKGRGILLLHDIHQTTATALPSLLKELKDRGYHVVQVVADSERPDSVPDLPASADTSKDSSQRAANANQDTPESTASPHRVKKPGSGKRRKPAVATVHDQGYGGFFWGWRQRQF
jgi:peptidoglycan/xylan/chitin deacetylase (PgdA/CDA1 family)